MEYKRGQVWFYKPEFPKAGSVQNGPRYSVIVSNDQGNKYSPIITVVPCTAQPKDNLPVHALFVLNGNFNVALCNQVTTVDKQELVQLKGTLPSYIMDKIDESMMIALGLTPSPAVPHFDSPMSCALSSSRWTAEKQKMFLNDCATMSDFEVMNKYTLTKNSLNTYRWKFKKLLGE